MLDFNIDYFVGAGLFTYFLFYGTWLFYVGFMHIKEHREEIQDKVGALIYGLYPLFWIALIMDVLFNWIIGTLMYVELPREFLFTSRCHRHKFESTDWRKDRAEWICKYMLDPFDKGHCG